MRTAARRFVLAGVIVATVVLARRASAQPFIGQNFTATVRDVNNPVIVPDTMGAVGPDHFVELLNSRYSVFRKSDGARVETKGLALFWFDAGTPSTRPFDPRVVYDPHARRWYALHADVPNFVRFAVSKTADPTEGWTGVDLDVDTVDTHNTDFPMIGYNRDAVVLSVNMFAFAGGGQAQTFAVVPKADLLAPAPSAAGMRLFQEVSQNVTGSSVQPAVDMDNGALPLPMLSANTATTLKRTSIAGTAAAPTLVTLGGSISVGVNQTAPPADQPGPKANISTGDTRFSGNVVLNNGELWAVHTVDRNSRASVRWYRINASNNALIESGIIDHPSLAFFFPSIAVNDSGDVLIGFSGTDPGTFVSAYAAVGKTSGGVTTFGQPFVTKAGVSDNERLDGVGRNRWGDYSATTLDPADPSIFWTIQEFVAATDMWGTQVTEIIIPQPGEARWKSPTSGSFNDAAAWFGGAAPEPSSHVIFSRATTPGGAGYTVFFSAGTTMVDRLSARQGNVTLDLGGGVLRATAALTVNEFGGTPTLTVTNGTLAVAGATRVRGGGHLVSRAGVIDVGSLSMEGGRVTLAAGGARILRAGALSMPADGGGTIQLNEHAMIVDYTGESPLPTVRNRVRDAYAGGAWDGPGITSALADAKQFAVGYTEASNLFAAFPAPFAGQMVDATTVLARLTRYGDANLDRAVNLDDFNRLAAHFGATDSTWSRGDFNYDGATNLGDFNLLAANFGLRASGEHVTPADWAALASALPEPAAATALVPVLLPALLAPRRRRRT